MKSQSCHIQLTAGFVCLLVFAILLSACDSSENLGQSMTPSAESQVDADAVPRMEANVIFSAPGRYRAPAGELEVDILSEPGGLVSYKLNRGVSSNAKMSTDALVMCWNQHGSLWLYHPDILINSHEKTADGYNMTFWGGGENIVDKMPAAFRDALPPNIHEIWEAWLADNHRLRTNSNDEPLLEN